MRAHRPGGDFGLRAGRPVSPRAHCSAKSGPRTCFSACVSGRLGLGFQSGGPASWGSPTGPWALRTSEKPIAHPPLGQTSWPVAAAQDPLLLTLQGLRLGGLPARPSPLKPASPSSPPAPPCPPSGVWPVGQRTAIPREPDFHMQAVAGVGPPATGGGTRPPESPCGAPPSAPAPESRLPRGRLREVCREPAAGWELLLFDISVSRFVAFHVCPRVHLY